MLIGNEKYKFLMIVVALVKVEAITVVAKVKKLVVEVVVVTSVLIVRLIRH